MKLAEALTERADLNRKIEQLHYRIAGNVLVQDGEQPAENPMELLKDLDEAVARLNILMGQINLTNCMTMVDGQTVTELIAKKDAMLLQIGIYRDVLNEARQSTSRARGTEIKIRPVINVVSLQKKTDVLAKEIRQLDNLLQMTNWQTELIEN